MDLYLCGVRGSLPAPGAEFAQIGGNTSCVAVARSGAAPTLILDAGTGLRTLTKLLGGEPFRGTLLLGHLHWDHIIGLPFFAAGDRPDASVHVLVPEQGSTARELLARAMAPPLFPITPDQLRGRWVFDTYTAGAFAAEGFTVLARDIPHKGGRTMGLRISDGQHSIAYLSDHAPQDQGPGADGLGELHPAALELAAGVDVLVHDAQYTAAELPSRAGWGHAAAQYCVTLAERCSVGRTLMFHHDPSRTDAQLRAIHAELAAGTEVCLEIATEGDVIRL